KYSGLRPWEIWLSEAQERMVLAVPPSNWQHIKDICDGYSIEAVSIGQFENSGRLHLYYADTLVADLDMHFLHVGIPRRQLTAQVNVQSTASTPKQNNSENKNFVRDIGDTLLKLLAHPDIRSKEAVVRLYDHEVQGGTVTKPMTGIDNHGPGDAVVLVPQPYLDEHVTKGSRRPLKGVALSNGICPSYSEHDAYAMAWAAIDEAMRNAVAVGADPDQVSLLDNFCWGNPNLPDRLGSLVRCVQGCYDAAIAYNAPFISGKDSLNNEYTTGDGVKHAIPGTLLISAMSIVPDIEHAVTMDLKQAGNVLYIIGLTRDETGGSHLNLVCPHTTSISTVPQPVRDSIVNMRRLHQAMSSGLVRSCHDCSEGGLAVALAEMSLAGHLGVIADVSKAPGASSLSPETLLFSESSGRFIVEVNEKDCRVFEDCMGDTTYAAFGKVVDSDTFKVTSSNLDSALNLTIDQLDEAWRGHVTPASVTSTAPSVPASLSSHSAPVVIDKPRVLIMHATGTNRDHDAQLACTCAGAEPVIVHVNQLLSGEIKLRDYAMVVLPGGFSYGDDLGAGTLWSLDLRSRLYDDLSRFINDSKPVLGICNGFQALVKAGLLPGLISNRSLAAGTSHSVTLAPNEEGRFECRWVYLKPESHSPCIFTAGMTELIYCPVAHGEGRVVSTDTVSATTLQDEGLVALTYVDAAGSTASYPGNPNGSMGGIAGLTNRAGNILGLMPHPENHIFGWQHPRHTRGENAMRGLKLFENGIKYAK
ncbi:MAG TPA: phosphoribosylformylglycinamidine synthase I, partial [Anaerolineae bacterium]